MRHPFDGLIIPAESNSSLATPAGEVAQPSRRAVLGWMLAAPAASAMASSAFAEQPTAPPAEIFRGGKPEGGGDEPAVGEEAAKVVGRHIYFVVPADFRAFNTRRRQELGVAGPYLPGLPGDEATASSKGYLAWLTKDQADRASKDEGVKVVQELTAGNVVVQGAPPKVGAATLRIYALPFGWPVAPEKGSFLPIEEFGKEIDRALTAAGAKANVIATGDVRQPYVQFADAANIPAAAMDAIKQNPQVYMLQWMTPIAESTRRLGEEGGVTTDRADEEGGPTTFAIGEEGGPSTRALGEEGGISTKRFGEEGGSTEALGEEGGVTTQALGEEGGGVSTRALGEEGGGVSTRALGEEGGRPPVPVPSPMPTID